jgi:integrase
MASKPKAPKFYRNADGTHSALVQLLVEPFARQSKSFCAEDYPSRKDASVAAVQWRDELRTTLIEQRQQGNVRVDLASYTLADLNKSYLADPVTAALAYHAELQRGLAWWDRRYGTCKVLDFGVLQGREARVRLMDGRRPATVNRYLSAQRSAWNWGREAGLIPVGRLWPPGLALSEPAERARFLSDDELAALLAAARARSMVLHAAIMVSIACGLRRAELLRLEWRDIDFARERITVMITKNGQPRAVHLPASAATVLRELKAGPIVSTTHVFLAPRGKVLGWQSLDRQWRAVCHSSGLQNFRWHDLRHTCASFLAQNGASLLEVGAVLGHRSVSATKRYSHLVQGAPTAGSAGLDAKLTAKAPL